MKTQLEHSDPRHPHMHHATRTIGGFRGLSPPYGRHSKTIHIPHFYSILRRIVDIHPVLILDTRFGRYIVEAQVMARNGPFSETGV